MKQIMISLSALLPSQYRKYVKGWDKGRYAKAFNDFAGENAYRVYLPLDKKSSESIVAPTNISHAVETLGYKVEDYRAGIAVDTSGKRRIRLGKLLAKHPELQKQFNEDKDRAGYKGKHLICISRHPYDIAGMSTDRGWTSCMHIEDGINREYVEAEINVGSIVAYVIEEKDTNIKRPVARIMIKPFYREDNFNKGRAILVAEPKTYPSITVPGFVPTVQRWLDKYINKGAKRGPYVLNDASYGDGNPDHVHVGNVSGKELAKELDFDANGNAKISGIETRISMLKRRPEALEFMKRATYMDLLNIAENVPNEVYEYLKSGKTVYLPPYSDVDALIPAPDHELHRIKIKILFGDMSLFDKVSALPRTDMDDDTIKNLLIHLPEKASKFVKDKITQDIIFEAMKAVQKFEELRSLIAVFGDILEVSEKERIRTIRRYVFAMENPTLDDVILSLDNFPRNIIWLHSVNLNKQDVLGLIDYLIAKHPSSVDDYVTSVLSFWGKDFTPNDSDFALKQLATVNYVPFDHLIKSIPLASLCALSPEQLSLELERRHNGNRVYRKLLVAPTELQLSVTDLRNRLSTPEDRKEELYTLEFEDYRSPVGKLLIKEKSMLLVIFKELLANDPDKFSDIRYFNSSTFNNNSFWKDIYFLDRKFGVELLTMVVKAGTAFSLEGSVIRFSSMPELFEVFIHRPQAYNFAHIRSERKLFSQELREKILAIDPMIYPTEEEQSEIHLLQRSMQNLNSMEGITPIKVPL